MVTFISLNLYYIRLFTCTERHTEIGVFDDLKRDNESRLHEYRLDIFARNKQYFWIDLTFNHAAL